VYYEFVGRTGIETQLQRLLQRQDIRDVLWSHLDRIRDPDMREDLRDGTVWKSWRLTEKTAQGECGRFWFTSRLFEIYLELFIDSFQPFTNTQKKMTAFFLCLGNLPREIRYQISNSILVGLLPGTNATSFIYIFRSNNILI
jgi:hypothetical protein